MDRPVRPGQVRSSKLGLDLRVCRYGMLCTFSIRRLPGGPSARWRVVLDVYLRLAVATVPHAGPRQHRAHCGSGERPGDGAWLAAPVPLENPPKALVYPSRPEYRRFMERGWFIV